LKTVFVFVKKEKEKEIMGLHENLYVESEANSWVENLLEATQEWKKKKDP